MVHLAGRFFHDDSWPYVLPLVPSQLGSSRQQAAGSSKKATAVSFIQFYLMIF